MSDTSINFLEFIQTFRRGELLRQGDDQLGKIMSAMRDTGGDGELTIKLPFKLNKAGQIECTPKVSAKIPQRAMGTGIYWADDDGRLISRMKSTAAANSMRVSESAVERYLKNGVTRDSNPLFQVRANLRKKLVQRERRLRRTGAWGAWERVENPHRFTAGWLGEVDHAQRNRVFSVLVRDVRTAVHLAVASLTGDRPTWHEMQRIKNELAGRDATAVEVYPPESQLVDEAEMFHLWVLPGPLPFSLHPATQQERDQYDRK